ncbi:hypothetical protein H6P81_005933 [Aristolochia fimbriata]|uniref:Uncharacterized protein n=1 Tax=Aristolochia fimbriata TaxID=158543 RepID=A0AAV7EWY0_ARIFI|nr:hypothetical protein H6P81_005933 [Aristolochia fimbriata]
MACVLSMHETLAAYGSVYYVGTIIPILLIIKPARPGQVNDLLILVDRIEAFSTVSVSEGTFSFIALGFNCAIKPTREESLQCSIHCFIKAGYKKTDAYITMMERLLIWSKENEREKNGCGAGPVWT